MIQTQTVMKVVDNSGARFVKCIQIPGGTFRRSARIGDMVRVCVSQLVDAKKLARKDKYSALITATRFPTRRPDGTMIRHDRNQCVVFDKPAVNFLGSRVTGFIPREIRGGRNEIIYKQVIAFAPATM